MAREQQNQEDQNLMDAWKNGGTYKGQPVTDDMVLEHWKKRLAGVSANDPLHDKYSNLVTQFEYSIAESKQSLLYAQGKISNAQMGQFYLDWSSKIPADSEFYRVLQRDAAQFMKAARSGSGGGGSGGGGGGGSRSGGTNAEKFNAATQSIFDQYEAGASLLTDALTQTAISNGLIGANQDLTYFQLGGSGAGQNDPGRMLELIRQINDNPSRPLFQTVDGQVVTGQVVIDRLKELDSSFNGVISADYYNDLLQRKREGIQQRLQIAQENGYTEIFNKTQKEADLYSEIARETGIWDMTTVYMHAREDLMKVWGDPTASPPDKLAAAQKYGDQLAKMSNMPGVDVRTANVLLNEAAGVRGDENAGQVDTLFENLYGRTDTQAGGGSSGGDNAGTVQMVLMLQGQVDSVKKGEAVWTYGVYDQNGNFNVQPGASSIGTMSQADFLASGAKVAAVPMASGALPVAVIPQNIRVAAQDSRGNILLPMNAQDAPTAHPENVGQVFHVSINGFDAVVYSYQNSLGQTIYTPTAPFAGQVHTDAKTGDLIVDLTGTKAVLSEAQYQLRDVKDSDGNVIGQERTGAITPGTFDPTAWMNPIDLHAGPDSRDQFQSLTVAAVLATPDGAVRLRDMSQTSTFKALIEAEAREAATINGVFVQGAYNVFQASTKIAVEAAISNASAGSRWDKNSLLTTIPLMPPSSADIVKSIASIPKQYETTSFEVLANQYRADAPLLKPTDRAKIGAGGTTIKTPAELNVPRVPQVQIDTVESPVPGGPSVLPYSYVPPAPIASPAAPAPAPTYTTPTTQYSQAGIPIAPTTPTYDTTTPTTIKTLPGGTQQI